MSTPARALDSAEWESFRLGRLVAAEHAPYFMHALFAVAPVAAPGLGTFAVDGSWRLYLDPALLLGESRWDSRTVGMVLLHEIGHLLRDHAGRAATLRAPVDRLAWNLAADAEINDDLIAGGVPLPDGAVTPAALGCADGDLAEVYYASLLQGSEHLPDDGSGGCGSGAGSGTASGELPEGVGLGDGSADPLSSAGADLVRRRVAQDVQAVEASSGRGTLPSGMTRWATAVLAPPTIPWERVLCAAVRRAVADRAGRTDYSYRRPPRRRVPRVIRPSMRSPSVVVTVIIDTSGSMSQSDLDAAMSEVSGVLSSSGIARDRITLLSCDANATAPRPLRSTAAVELTGGGGTDMRIGIEAAEASRPSPDVVIVLTDGGTPWPTTPTRARLICAVICPSPPTGTPEWATTVHIPPHAK